MNNRARLPGESTITQWAFSVEATSGLLVLSNYRVWLESEGPGSYAMTSLALDEVQWGGLVRVHNPLLLVVAAVVLFVGLSAAAQADTPNVAVAGSFGALLVCVVLGVAYLRSRRVELHLGSGAGLITTRVPGGGRDDAQRFISTVEQAALQARARG
jgi:hypothetical protein